MPEINKESQFQQVAGFIRQAITDGRLREGDKAPTVREIVAEYDIAHATAHRALKTLQAEGYLVARPGRNGGSFVTSEQERSRASAQHAEKAIRTGRVYPEGQRAKILDAGLAAAPEHVAISLGIKTGDPAIFRKRVRLSAQDEPLAISTSWFAGELAEKAPQLLQPERVLNGTFSLVAQATGRTVTGVEEQLRAVAAEDDVAGVLGVEPGTPILAGRNWFKDSDGHVLEYGESFTIGFVEGRWGSAAGE